MRRRSTLSLFPKAILCPLVAIAAGCGDGDDITVGEYFERVDDAEQRFQQSLDPGWSLNATWGQLVNTLEEINPPDELEVAHRGYVDAARKVMEFIRLRSDEVYAANERLFQACRNLEDVANVHHIEVGLTCQELYGSG